MGALNFLSVAYLHISVIEFFGTAVLLLFGCGVCANNALRTSPARGSGWLLICWGWGLGVFAGAIVADKSGAHLNPAVTLGLALSGKVSWSAVPYYIIGQLLGAIFGAVLTWLVFKLQFDANNVDDEGRVTGGNRTTGTIFFTAPANRGAIWNCVTEIIATCALVLTILVMPEANKGLGYAAVAFVVVGIGMSLGGPTGYAINPVRDLGPRIAYAILPIPGKGTCNWGYAWVPIVGPLLGAALAAGIAPIL